MIIRFSCLILTASVGGSQSQATLDLVPQIANAGPQAIAKAPILLVGALQAREMAHQSKPAVVRGVTRHLALWRLEISVENVLRGSVSKKSGLVAYGFDQEPAEGGVYPPLGTRFII